jgi:hypothetical protein
VITALTTVVALVFLIIGSVFAPTGWNAPIAFLLIRGGLGIGLLVNLCAGPVATARGEYCGGRIALAGIAVLAITVAVLIGMRRF